MLNVLNLNLVLLFPHLSLSSRFPGKMSSQPKASLTVSYSPLGVTSSFHQLSCLMSNGVAALLYSFTLDVLCFITAQSAFSLPNAPGQQGMSNMSFMVMVFLVLFGLLMASLSRNRSSDTVHKPRNGGGNGPSDQGPGFFDPDPLQ